MITKTNKLNSLGIGPKVALIFLPWLAGSLFLSYKFKGTFAYFENGIRLPLFLGIAFVAAGSLFYFLTAQALLRGLKEKKLVTTGPYHLCRNPLYSSILFLILPGISLWLNSWLILSASLVGYILFKILIKSEYAEMEKIFGDAYRKYSAGTPEFFPFPFRKWVKGSGLNRPVRQ